MRYFINIIAVLGLPLMLLCSCTKNLEYKVYDQVSPTNFPKTKKDVQTAVTGIYHVFSDGWTGASLDRSHFMLTELPTDELNTAWPNYWNREDNFLWTSNTDDITNVYTFYQKGITRATLLLDRLAHISLSDTSFLSRSIAEVRALRGIFSYYLFDMYGPVPVVTDPAIADDVTKNWTPKRPTREKMVNFIAAELKEAAEELPVQYSEEIEYGRLTRGGALAFLLKLYMHEKDWQNAKKVSAAIMGLGQYQLLNDYNDIFDHKNENLSNKEIIVVIPRVATPHNLSQTWFACVMPPQPAYRSNTISVVWGGLKTPWSFYDKFNAKDQRKKRLLRYYYDVDGNYVDYKEVHQVKAVGAIPMKWSEDEDQVAQYQGSDFIIFRYAAVLLYRAEALNHINNGPGPESVSLVNKIRKRAGVDSVKVSDFSGMKDFDTFLLDEEGRELWCEGYRREDLIRHGELISVAHSQEHSNAQPYMVLYPIPQSARNANPNLEKNPGY